MSKNSKKAIIIFLVNSGNFFGAENVNLKIIKSLRSKYSFYYASAKGMVDEYLEKNKVEHIIVEKISRKTIRQIEHDYHPDLIHATDYKTSVMCAFSNIKTPFISHLHSDALWLNKLHPFIFAYLYAAKKAVKILTVSESIEQKYVFSKLVRDKIQCVSNPVCCKDILENINPDKKKQYDICFTGRFSKEKNPLLFLDLVKSLKKEYPNLKAIMIGDGSLRKRVKEKIKSDGMSDYVFLTGFQTNPYRMMEKAKILLLPSKYEGYPLVVLEALTLGLPCVVSNVGGLSDIITEQCGFLCDNKIDYQTSLKILLDNEQIYKLYSIQAQKRALYLDNQSDYMGKIDLCYQRALRGR